MKIGFGATRIVFIFENYVIKVPKFWHWQMFLRGLISNINEGQTWRWNSGKFERGYSHLLCPVMWTSWGGWLLIMKRAKPVRQEWWDKQDIPIWYHHIQEFGGDDACKNYGWYCGRLVKTDYGDLDKTWGIDFKRKAYAQKTRECRIQ